MLPNFLGFSLFQKDNQETLKLKILREYSSFTKLIHEKPKGENK